MPEKTSAELADAIKRFNRWNDECHRITAGQHLAEGPRAYFAASLCQLSLEHSVAIAILLHDGMIASAKALYRPQFEAFARGMWLLYCASDEQVEEFVKNKDVIPKKFHVLSAAVDAATKTVIVGIIREKHLKLMNDLTHGGTIQATDRVRSKVMQSNYDHTDALEQLKGTAVIAGFAAPYMMRATGRENAARQLNTAFDLIFPPEWGGKFSE